MFVKVIFTSTHHRLYYYRFGIEDVELTVTIPKPRLIVKIGRQTWERSARPLFKGAADVYNTDPIVKMLLLIRMIREESVPPSFIERGGNMNN